MGRILWGDIETRSTANVTVCGAHELARDPDLRLLCFSYAIGDEDVKTWHCAFADGDPDLAEPVPDDLLDALSDPDCVFASWNASFERLILNAVRHRYQLPPLPVEKFLCVMTWARCFNLPGSLETATKVWLPKAQRKIDGSPTKWMWSTKKPLLPEHEDAYRNGQVPYCEADVASMREMYKLLPNPTPEFIAEYHASEIINDQGCMMDLRLVNAAITLAPVVDDEIRAELDEITNNEVKPRGPSLRQWLMKVLPPELTELLTTQKKYRDGYGWKQRVRPSTDKHVRAKLLEAMNDFEGMEDVREALALYDEANRAAVTKYAAARDRTSPDEGCLRGQYLFAGAGQTGRFSATGMQVHNLIRMVPKEALAYVDAILTCDPDHIRKVTGMTVNQALSRVIRVAFMAEVMRKLIWGDWSAIEARMLPWLSADEAAERVLNAYREGADLYIQEASGIYGKPEDQINKDERQAGKVVILACLSGDTRVMVQRSGCVQAVPLVNVHIDDLVFDGVEWVAHAGVVERGVRKCLALSGVTLTPDHLVWCGPSMGWTTAEVVASNGDMQRLALDTAMEHWSSQGIFSDGAAVSKALLCSATAAAQSMPSASITSRRGEPHAATPAPSAKQPTPAPRSSSTTPGHAPTLNTADACSTAFPPSTPDATARTTSSGGPTAGAASPAGGSSSTATSASGGAAGQADSTPCAGGTTCSHISAPCPAGTTPSSNWTEKTTTRGTTPATCASSDDPATCATDAMSMTCQPASATSKPSLPVFDLADAGPRNRFTIMTDDGPLIVHNCGYNGGVNAYQAMAKNYGLKLTDAEAGKIVKGWRRNNPWARRFWRALEKNAILAIQNPGLIYTAGRIQFVFSPGLLGGTLLAFMPSGRPLVYPEAKVVVTEKFGKEQETIIFRHPTFGMVDTYGGKIAENVTQGESASLLRALLVRMVKSGRDVVLHTHDECVLEVDEADVETAARHLLKEMMRVPDWAEGLPLAAEVEWGSRYKIAEGELKVKDGEVIAVRH